MVSINRFFLCKQSQILDEDILIKKKEYFYFEHGKKILYQTWFVTAEKRIPLNKN